MSNMVNRQGYHNSLFNLAEFAHQLKEYDNFGYKAKVLVNNVEKFKVESIRTVFNIPKKVEGKMRVSEINNENGVVSFLKSDTVKVIIEPQRASKEPVTEITITKWFEETEGLVKGIEDVTEVKIMPNKWLYFEGNEK